MTRGSTIPDPGSDWPDRYETPPRNPIREVLRRVLATASSRAAPGPNDAAVEATDRALRRLSDPDGRLTPLLRAAFLRGVGDRRTASTRGREGVLSVHTAKRAAETVLGLHPEHLAKLNDVLQTAGGAGPGAGPGADPHLERALILEALGARQRRLLPGVDPARPPEPVATAAFTEVVAFAEAIRGTPRASLVEATTLLDVSDANTSPIDPRRFREVDDEANNDGLFQHFDSSCGPAVAQLVRAESDPAYALRVRREGALGPTIGHAHAQEQRRVLEAGGGTAVSRLGRSALARLLDVLARTEGAGLSAGEGDVLRAGLTGRPTPAADFEAVLEAVRALDGGHPTDAEVDAIRSNHRGGRRRWGVGMTLEAALDPIAKPSVGFLPRPYPTHGGLPDPIQNRLDADLQRGYDVPIRVALADNSGGHFMLISDGRGGPDARRYLVSDPWSGRTDWVSTRELDSGRFLGERFGLSQTHLQHVYLSAERGD